MSAFDDFGFDTLKLRAGYDPADHNYASSVPIYETVSYAVGSAETYDRIAAGVEDGHVYTRCSNPTIKVLEDRIAALDKAKNAVAVGSGVAAITYGILSLCEGGGRMLTTEQLYGGIVHSLDAIFPKYGVKVDKVSNYASIDEFEAKIADDTKLIYVESVSNPTAIVSDIENLAKLAHKHGIPLVVDNTVATPYLFNPIVHGADIIIYSATKGIGGHGSAIGGLVVDAGRFDWDSPKFPQFKEKNISFRDLNGRDRSYLEAFGKDAFSAKVRSDYLTNFGAALSPFNAYILLLGLETLSERLDKEVRNVEKIVDFLTHSEYVEWVSYPYLEGNKSRELAKKYFPKGVGQLFSFGVKGGEEAVYRLCRNVKLFSYQLNLGDSKSLIANAKRSTHGVLTDAELGLADIPDNTVRVSIGTEDADDLIRDLQQAFEASAAEASESNASGAELRKKAG